jgi:inner membrane protein
MAAVLTILYIYLYILLQLENLSLLFGAIGLFIALTAVLYVTRNIDWYGEREGA